MCLSLFCSLTVISCDLNGRVECNEMDAATISLIVVLIGAIFIIIEALSPGAFMIIPGTVLVIVGIIGYMVPGFITSIYSPIVGLCIAVPTTLITIKGYQLLGKPEPPATTVNSSVIGRKGIVTAATDSETLKGKVKIDSETWSAQSDEPLAVGTHVIIEAAEGVHVKVRADKE
jgi:membrane protein implicated in regulation of membrane protease activity